MHTDNTATPAAMLANEADAALRAATSANKDENARHIEALRADANEDHIAEHIRGMVAATMGNLSVEASVVTRDNAAHWQQWALATAEGLAPTAAI
jgi:hypothetical protein